MELLIVRHGPAGDRQTWRPSGRPDSERPLTKDGRRKARAAARGLSRVVDNVDLVATSPWLRARQTAEIVSAVFGVKLVEISELIPNRPLEDCLAWLKMRHESRIVLVGHEPHLSRLISWLLTGSDRTVLRLKKSQAALLKLRSPAPGQGQLFWSLHPRLLRALTCLRDI